MKLSDVPTWLWFLPGAILIVGRAIYSVCMALKSKAARVAVYDRNAETDPMILMPERVRVPMPEKEEREL